MDELEYPTRHCVVGTHRAYVRHQVVAHAISSTALGALMDGYMRKHDCFLYVHHNLEPYAYFGADAGDASATLLLGYRAKGVHANPATLLYSYGHGGLAAEEEALADGASCPPQADPLFPRAREPPPLHARVPTEETR